MAAKLEWNGPRLMLWPFELATVSQTRTSQEWYYKCGLGSPPSGFYAEITDCMQDCESETRRLLKKAGVEVAL